MDIVCSKNNVPIRLSEERWFHITEEHSEMAGYYYEVIESLEEPDAVYEGGAGECLAIKGLEKGKYLVVVYREVSKNDGFIITAFLTRRKRQFEKRRRIWP